PPPRRQRRVAGRRVEEAELRAEPAGPAAEPAPGRLQPHGVVLPRVRGVAHHTVHPRVGRDAGAGEDDAVDRRGGERELAQERVDRAARVAGVVLQPREPLLGRAADDRAVAQHGRRRAMSLADPQHDHDRTIIAAFALWPGRPAPYRLSRTSRSDPAWSVSATATAAAKAGATPTRSIDAPTTTKNPAKPNSPSSRPRSTSTAGAPPSRRWAKTARMAA